MIKFVYDISTQNLEKIPLTQEEVEQNEQVQLRWQEEQAKPKPPTEIDYLLDLDYRLSMIELGLV